MQRALSATLPLVALLQAAVVQIPVERLQHSSPLRERSRFVARARVQRRVCRADDKSGARCSRSIRPNSAQQEKRRVSRWKASRRLAVYTRAIEFAGIVTLGTPPQMFNVGRRRAEGDNNRQTRPFSVFDTGSGHRVFYLEIVHLVFALLDLLWVPKAGCKSSGQVASCVWAVRRATRRLQTVCQVVSHAAQRLQRQPIDELASHRRNLGNFLWHRLRANARGCLRVFRV